MILHDDTIHNLKEKDSGQKPCEHNLERTRNLPVKVCDDDPELTCERRVTWARSEEDEEQVVDECSQIDEGDITKQEVLKIPTLSSD